VLPGLGEGADRFIARAEVLCARLVGEAAQLDPIVANRIEDLGTDVRLIFERREREAEHARDAAERDAQRERQAEEQRRIREDVERQVAEAHRQADEARAGPGWWRRCSSSGSASRSVPTPSHTWSSSRSMTSRSSPPCPSRRSCPTPGW